MKHIAINEAAMCRDLAAVLRLDAAHATLPGYATRLIRGAADLERQALVLTGWASMFV
jgi:hypothetical protein